MEIRDSQKTFELECKCRGKCWKASAHSARTRCIQIPGMCICFCRGQAVCAARAECGQPLCGSTRWWQRGVLCMALLVWKASDLCVLAIRSQLNNVPGKGFHGMPAGGVTELPIQGQRVCPQQLGAWEPGQFLLSRCALERVPYTQCQWLAFLHDTHSLPINAEA